MFSDIPGEVFIGATVVLAVGSPEIPAVIGGGETVVLERTVHQITPQASTTATVARLIAVG